MLKSGTATVNRVGRILEADKAFLKIACLKSDEAKWHYVVDMLNGVDNWNVIREQEKERIMRVRRRNSRMSDYVVSCSRVDEKRWHITFSRL